jgi:AcrR family transcriptional regulator
MSLREKISSAAQELYLRDGIEGLSMRKVAEMVGVSAPALYRYFQSKDELLNEIVIEGLKVLENYLRPALDAATPDERLRKLTDNYLRFAVEQPKFFDFAFLVPKPDSSGLAEEVTRPISTTFRMAMEQVSACMEQGTIARDDPIEIAITVWAEVHGLVTLYRTGRFGNDPEVFGGIYRKSVERLLRGLEPR